jgi:hypothetical protein
MACGGSGSGGDTTSTITLVGASCNPTAITSGQTSQCTATVSGTGSFSSTVVWTSSAGGTINATSGLFTAGNVPFTTQVTITATSTQDVTKAGSTTLTVAAAGTVTGVTASCSPSAIQTGQLSQCTATVQGTGNFSPNVDFSASGGSINPITGIFSSPLANTYTITATSQQNPKVTGTATVVVSAGVNNQLAIVVDPGPNGNYVNGLFATVTVCQPGTATCQTIDHILVDTGSNGLRLLAQGAAGGKFDPTGFPLQVDASNNPIGECNQFIGGVMWGSVSLATIQMAGETASTVPGAVAAGVPVQVVGDTRVPAIPASCTALGSNIGDVTGLGANGVLGVGNFQQDCGPGCVSGNAAPTVYYTCAGGSCATSFLPLPQQVTNPVWVLPSDNNGVLIQLPSVPSGGTTTISGNLIFGIGTQLNNSLGSATVFDTNANAYFTTTFNGIPNACSYIDSGSNAYYFPSSGYPGLSTCSGGNSSFYCPANLLTLTAGTQSASNTNGSTGNVPFNIGNANTLFSNNNGQNFVFGELGGPNAPIGNCGSFAWGLPFFYGKANGVFTGIEQMPVSGTSYVGPFWAF